MIPRFKAQWFKHDWELPYLDGVPRSHLQEHVSSDIAHILESCSDNGTRFEIECYDIGHLYTAAHFLERGLAEAAALHPVGLRPPRRHRPAPGRRACTCERTADRLFGDLSISVVRARRRPQPDVHRLACRPCMGGNVRVGLEDSLWLGRGHLAKSNAEQVTKIRRILEEIGLQVATPNEAREMLKLKGRDNVAF